MRRPFYRALTDDQLRAEYARARALGDREGLALIERQADFRGIRLALGCTCGRGGWIAPTCPAHGRISSGAGANGP